MLFIFYSEFKKSDTIFKNPDPIDPNVAKVGGLQSQGAKGEAIVNLLRTLCNSGSGVLRLSRRVNNMA